MHLTLNLLLLLRWLSANLVVDKVLPSHCFVMKTIETDSNTAKSTPAVAGVTTTRSVAGTATGTQAWFMYVMRRPRALSFCWRGPHSFPLLLVDFHRFHR